MHPAYSTAVMLVLLAAAAWRLARREQLLRRKWSRFHAMIEHSSDAVLLVNPEGDGVLYASPAFERMTGYRVEDLRGCSVAQWIHPDDLAVVQQKQARLRETPGITESICARPTVIESPSET